MELLYRQFIREKQYLRNVSARTVDAYHWAWKAFTPALVDRSCVTKSDILQRIEELRAQGQHHAAGWSAGSDEDIRRTQHGEVAADRGGTVRLLSGERACKSRAVPDSRVVDLSVQGAAGEAGPDALRRPHVLLPHAECR